MQKKSFIKILLERRIPQILGSYLVAGTSLILFIEYLVEKYQFQSHYPTLALFALMGILPSVIILAYFHGAPGKDEWTKIEKIGIPVNILFIGVILFFGDSLNVWNLETEEPKDILIHITSLPEYISKYEEAKELYNYSKGRKLIPLSSNHLDILRKNLESLLLSEYINTPYEMIVKHTQEDVNFIDKYTLLGFDDESFSNVTINYERYNFDNIHYFNIYQYEDENNNADPKYFFRHMKWWGLPSTRSNGSNVESDFTKIETEIVNDIKAMYDGVGKIGKVSSVEDDIVYIQLTNYNVKKNMNLGGSSLYEYAKDGRKNRIEDLTNAIKFLSSKNDSASRVTIQLHNDEIISIQDSTGMNSNYNRVFSAGFNYKLKVIDLKSNKIAVAKVMELSYPYVIIRAGDEIWIEK